MSIYIHTLIFGLDSFLERIHYIRTYAYWQPVRILPPCPRRSFIEKYQPGVLVLLDPQFHAFFQNTDPAKAIPNPAAGAREGSRGEQRKSRQKRPKRENPPPEQLVEVSELAKLRTMFAERVEGLLENGTHKFEYLS
jgi:hypothetical protein